jgi:hypothetical protein
MISSQHCHNVTTTPSKYHHQVVQFLAAEHCYLFHNRLPLLPYTASRYPLLPLPSPLWKRHAAHPIFYYLSLSATALHSAILTTRSLSLTNTSTFSHLHTHFRSPTPALALTNTLTLPFSHQYPPFLSPTPSRHHLHFLTNTAINSRTHNWWMWLSG